MTTTNHQGRDPKHYGNQEKSASFAIMVLAIATLIALLVNKCEAQTGYRYCVHDSAGIWCANTLDLEQAIDSLTVWSGLPVLFFETQIESSRYIYLDTERCAVYIERKKYVKTCHNGKLKLKRKNDEIGNNNCRLVLPGICILPVQIYLSQTH